MNSTSVAPISSSLNLIFFPTWLKRTLLVAAAAIFVLGIVVMLLTSKETGSAALIGTSLALLILVIFGGRISSIEAMGVKLQMVNQLDKAADQAELEGKPEAADELRQSARRLLDSSSAVAATYEFVRTNEESSWERSNKLETLLLEARKLAFLAHTSNEVADVFASGGSGQRISALAMMQERPELAHVPSLEQAMATPLSAFEQFHALRAAEAVLQHGPEQDRERLVTAIHHGLEANAFGGSSSDRSDLARRILKNHSAKR